MNNILNIPLKTKDLLTIQKYIKTKQYQSIVRKNHLMHQDWESNLDAIEIPQLNYKNYKPWIYFHIQHTNNQTYLECELYLDSCEFDSIQCFNSPMDILSWQIQIPKIFPYDAIKFTESDNGISFTTELNKEIHNI